MTLIKTVARDADKRSNHSWETYQDIYLHLTATGRETSSTLWLKTKPADQSLGKQKHCEQALQNSWRDRTCRFVKWCSLWINKSHILIRIMKPMHPVGGSLYISSIYILHNAFVVLKHTLLSDWCTTHFSPVDPGTPKPWIAHWDGTHRSKKLYRLDISGSACSHTVAYDSIWERDQQLCIQ